MRHLTRLDRLLGEIDTAIRTLLPPKQRFSSRPSPSARLKDIHIEAQQQKHIAGLMRVNHSGEICAQALYQGQGLTAKLPKTREKMMQAAAEEVDHLAWCEQRLQELNARPSLLNPVWYCSSFMIGALAGLAGDKVSLGFVAETERQVSDHLSKHLQQIPKDDLKTQAILTQMHEDESHHAETAIEAGAMELPWMIKNLMQTLSKLMTKSSYHF